MPQTRDTTGEVFVLYFSFSYCIRIPLPPLSPPRTPPRLGPWPPLPLLPLVPPRSLFPLPPHYYCLPWSAARHRSATCAARSAPPQFPRRQRREDPLCPTAPVVPICCLRGPGRPPPHPPLLPPPFPLPPPLPPPLRSPIAPPRPRLPPPGSLRRPNPPSSFRCSPPPPLRPRVPSFSPATAAVFAARISPRRRGPRRRRLGRSFAAARG